MLRLDSILSQPHLSFLRKGIRTVRQTGIARGILPIMRIGITLQSLDPTWGGIGIYTEEIVKHLLKLDRDNEYILIYPGFGAPRKLLGRYQRKYKNVTEVDTEFSKIPSGLYWDQIVVPKVARQYGVDVLFNPFLSVPVAGRFKKIMVIHNVEYHTVPKVYDWKMYTRWFFLEKVILPTADRVISVSHVMTQDFRRTVKYPIKNVRTIHHGVSEKFHVIQEEDKLCTAKEEYRLPDPFILFVGHLYPQKNFSTLVKALHLIATEIPHKLVVVGRPRWKYKQDLQLIGDLGLRDRVHFLHWVSNDDLPAIYNLAACLVYPSLYESFGLVQLEAMACGCPVIGARAGAIPEISGEAAVLFNPQNQRELGDAMLKVTCDPDFRRSLVERGLARAKEFTWDKCASETLQVLKEVVVEG
jgi:glycosyltransferase involved in cell wall biosynthesis